ncbi:Membrane fusion component of tripartite multidrug resistance system [Paramagnetospirillum magnetotacticum MS-1]|uniref:Membrane fusion component of tripartite multidrug resistance system n=1 Tax=Paramagnetospirillum magnetotacticum MS-1 TaxID=272627 RepID=A0A0C2YYE2_PARME|nr:HlyD family secretion protein [Paramagnetospirillum magnetotacticum]KIL99680.1 Membrane fusion component of tripartite multidrug resistance system [Paramagnetospirillum magnetotacticum MS-1]
MKKPIAIAAALIVASIGGWSLLRWSQDWRWQESTDDAYVDGDITAISPKVAGHVVELAARDNRMVAKGDVLVRIDERDYRARLDEAAGQVKARLAQLVQIDDRVAVQESVIAQSGASISAAKAEVVRATADFERSRKLVREDYVSRQRFDISQADAARAAAGLTGSGAQLQGARRQLSVLASEHNVALAQLEQAKAALILAETELEATVIRSPVDGVIGNRAVRDGQYVRPGQMLLAVVPLGNVWIDANFKETQIGRMKPGNRAEIKVDAFPGAVITGTVDSFAPASGAKFSLLPPENATGNFTKVVQRIPVRIRVDPDSPLAGQLRPGLSVVVKVDTRDEGK